MYKSLDAKYQPQSTVSAQSIHSLAVFKLNCGKAIDISLQAKEG
jgi:hypothetical protein